jgi:FkbM family methyltransferase
MINTKIKNFFKAFIRITLPERILRIIEKVYYERLLRFFTESDEVDFKVIKHLVKCGDCVVDVGANIGVYTKYMSELVGVDGRVYSIEPIPLTFEILRSNIKKLGLKNVELINCAISNTNGRVTMEVPLYELGGENFYKARIVGSNTNSSLRQVKVESKTIDYIFSKLALNISFIKCDVEGHEFQCIKGAKKIIEESKPALLIEISGDPDSLESTSYEIFELLNEEGYEAYFFDGINLNRRHLGDKSINYFFLLPKHLRLLKNQGFFALNVN